MVFHEDRGFFSITKNSAKWFMESGKFLVEIDDFKPTANIYAVGVKGSTDDIRPGDEVVIHCGKDIRGVGTARMPVDAMLTLKKGVAVKVRG
jgi:archaeosine synthase